MVVLNDIHGRGFKTLRVSLLSTCNLGCVYCTMGTEDETAVEHKPQTPATKFVDIITRLHQLLDLQTIRFTGGEPLLYRELPELVKGVNALNGPKLKITTNAFLLGRMAQTLKDAGLEYVNVSLDAVTDDTFFAMSRRKQLPRTLQGIDTALACGLEVKINSVIMKGKNHDQILPLVDYAFGKNIRIRFLEVMAMGHLFGHADEYKFSQAEILDTIAQKYSFHKLPRISSSTANYWVTTEGHIFGIIANDTEPFCHDCNRLRLDAEGNMYGCLSDSHPIALTGKESDDQMLGLLQRAMEQKQVQHFTGSEMSMMHIGG